MIQSNCWTEDKNFVSDSTVNGEKMVDQPIAINISKDGVREQTTVKEPGMYALDLGALNDPETNEQNSCQNLIKRSGRTQTLSLIPHQRETPQV